MLPEESANPETVPRIGDGDRDRVVGVLRLHCTEGRLTLDEFSDRVGEAYGARTSDDLDAVLRGLPVPWAEDAPAENDPHHPRRGRQVRWLAAVFANASRRGRFTLGDESIAFAAFGDCTLDLSEALIEGPNPLVTAVAVFGNVTVIIPEGIEVNLQGIPLFGSTSCDTGRTPAVPGSPVVTVRALAAFGDVRVRPPRGRSDERRFGRSNRL